MGRHPRMIMLLTLSTNIWNIWISSVGVSTSCYFYDLSKRRKSELFHRVFIKKLLVNKVK